MNKVYTQHITSLTITTHTCQHFASSHFKVFIILLSLDWCRFAEAYIYCINVLHMCPMCGFGCFSAFLNVYGCDFLCILEGRRKRKRERETHSRSLDIIEDDISDYPKDRNLSLSVICLQLFYHPAFSEYVAFNCVWILTNVDVIGKKWQDMFRAERL